MTDLHHDLDETRTLAVVAHDIKAPLSAIISLLGVIDKGYVKDIDKSKELVSKAINKAEILIKMLDDILDYSLLSDKSMMKREKLDIITVLGDAISMMGPYATQRKIQIYFKPKSDVRPMIHGNYTFLMRVFNNLIMNAIKYNKNRGKIMIQYDLKENLEGEKVHIIIKDSGIGISKEDLDIVFNVFERGRTARKNIDGSIGLGLSLVKQIMTDHGGSIDIKSVINKGTTITLTLPVIK